nr:TPA_asm: NADH dehydrogenase subunit 4 [Pseudomyrmex flavicornis]
MMKLIFLFVFMMFMIPYCKVFVIYSSVCIISSFMMIFLFKFDSCNMISFIYSNYLYLDKSSYPLIVLSLWILSMMYLSLDKSDMIKEFMFAVMLLVLLMFFFSGNLIMMYLFFELSLIPTYMMIVYWGLNPERVSASFYLLIYMLLISLPLLFYIYRFMVDYGSLTFLVNEINKDLLKGWWDYLIMVGAFLIKLPIYVFHVWLPKAHVEAPVYGSMILAGVLLKLGGYGLYRVVMFVKPIPLNNMFIISLGLIGGAMISFLSMIQVDMKSLVAYSSVVHMNLMMSSFLTMMMLGWSSTLMIMISHGICSSGLFYMVNMYYSRSSSRLLLLNKGMINYMPVMSIWWFLLCSANFSFPLSLNFIGEITMLMTLLSWNITLVIIMVVACFFSGAYSLYLFSYVHHGQSSYMIMSGSGSAKEVIVLLYHYIPLAMILLDLLIFFI